MNGVHGYHLYSRAPSPNRFIKFFFVLEGIPMKKLRILILCLDLCFLVACGEKTDEKVSEGKAEEIVQNATDWTRE